MSGAAVFWTLRSWQRYVCWSSIQLKQRYYGNVSRCPWYQCLGVKTPCSWPLLWTPDKLNCIDTEQLQVVWLVFIIHAILSSQTSWICFLLLEPQTHLGHDNVKIKGVFVSVCLCSQLIPWLQRYNQILRTGATKCNNLRKTEEKNIKIGPLNV